MRLESVMQRAEYNFRVSLVDDMDDAASLAYAKKLAMHIGDQGKFKTFGYQCATF